MPYQKKDGAEYYEKDSNGNEIYAVHSDGHQIYAMDVDNNPFYAKNKDRDQVYAKDGQGNDYVAEIFGELVYARTYKGDKYYPRDKEGNEFAVQENGTFKYIMVADSVVHPVKKEGRPAYPRDDLNNEVYSPSIIRIGRKQYYARLANGNEFYPPEELFVTEEFDIEYAQTANGDILYPKSTHGDEYYFKELRKSSHYSDLHLLFSTTRKVRYARTKDGNDIYPRKREENVEYEVPIPNKGYAESASGVVVYPLDPYNNEYTVPGVRALPRYPVTNDGFAIVPNVDGKPAFLAGNDEVADGDLVGLLYRKYLNSDFVTKVKPKVKPLRSVDKKPYSSCPLVIKVVQGQSSWGWMMSLLSSVLVLLLFSLYFLCGGKTQGGI